MMQMDMRNDDVLLKYKETPPMLMFMFIFIYLYY